MTSVLLAELPLRMNTLDHDTENVVEGLSKRPRNSTLTTAHILGFIESLYPSLLRRSEQERISMMLSSWTQLKWRMAAAMGRCWWVYIARIHHQHALSSSDEPVIPSACRALCPPSGAYTYSVLIGLTTSTHASLLDRWHPLCCSPSFKRGQRSSGHSSFA